MTIDWITVSAQIVNFLILVWLLKRFLYKPVIKAMDKREQRVTERLKEAQQREQAATDLGKSYSQKQAELEQSRDQVLQEARDQATKIKHELTAEARDEVAKTRASWQQQAELEKNQFLETLQQKVAQSVLQVARKALSDLANSELESQLVATFISKLRALSSKEIERFQQAAEPISIKTSFTLDDSNRQQIEQVIQTILQTEAQPSYEPLTNKGWGIELDIAEQRLGWNIDSYLDDFEPQFEKAIKSSRR